LARTGVQTLAARRRDQAGKAGAQDYLTQE
jgi:hypothetical protein